MRIFAIILGLIILTSFSQNSYAQKSTTESPIVLKAVAPRFSIGAFLISDGGRLDIHITIDNKGEVIKANLDDRHTGSLGEKDKTISELLTTAQKWRFNTVRNPIVRKATITFFFRVMPVDTEESELSPVFIAPFTFEVRTNDQIEIEIITDTKRKTKS